MLIYFIPYGAPQKVRITINQIGIIDIVSLLDKYKPTKLKYAFDYNSEDTNLSVPPVTPFYSLIIY